MNDCLRKEFSLAFPLIVFLSIFSGCHNFEKLNNSKIDSCRCSLIISANDQKFALENGIGSIREYPKTGSISILDISSYPYKVKVENLENVPCSVIGPPTCVAITPDESLAIVAGAMKIDPNNPSKQIPNDVLTIISIEDGKPELIKQLKVDKQPSGVAISPDGHFALVTHRASGTLVMLTIQDKVVSIIDRVQVCEPGKNLSDVAISKDTKFALASVTDEGTIAVLQIKFNEIIDTGKRIEVGSYPYQVEINPKGDIAAVANVGQGKTSLSILDITNTDEIKMIDNFPLPPGPECVAFSPNGEYLAISSLNNSHAKTFEQKRREYGLVIFMKRKGKSFEIIQKKKVERIPQASIFTYDSRYLAVSSFENKHVRMYQVFNDRIESTETVIKLPGNPVALRRVLY